MNINEDFIKKVASNARLKLNNEEINKFTIQFKEILDCFSKIDEVDVSNTKISVQPIALKNHLRDDVEQKCLSQEDSLKNTTHKKEGYFKGPKAV